MMVQYSSIKAQHRDALLFYRMGDFYEMFFDDAVAAAEALDIALTKRGRSGDKDIPMCGVPVHTAETYLQNLIRKGFRVAVCEQTEDPAEAKKRGSKSVVKREVKRLLTPGTLTEDSLLDARRHNFLAAICGIRGESAIAWADISSGDFRVLACPPSRLGPQLARVAPREILLSSSGDELLEKIAAESGCAITPLPGLEFDSSEGDLRLRSLFGVSSLDAFGVFGRPEMSALGAIVRYLELTQKGRLPLLRPPHKEKPESVMQIDAATRRNLELTESISGSRDGTLLSVLDRTRTPAGARLLERRLSAPSTDLSIIESRLEAVEFYAGNDSLREIFRKLFKKLPDMERSLSRLGLERAGPRDLAAIRDGLEIAEEAGRLLEGESAPAELANASRNLSGFGELQELLESALVAQPPLLLRDGGAIASGQDPELDEMRRHRDEGRSVIAAMQAQYVRDTGINSLKIKYNNVLGYFVETTSAYSSRMLAEPLSKTFVHRQTMANALRFTTAELAKTESLILNAGTRSLEIEKRIFGELCEAAVAKAAQISVAARSLAEIDVAISSAHLAVAENWCRPIVDDSEDFSVVRGRHPVVEAAVKKNGSPFVANSCFLSDSGDAARIRLVTGPNMSGKSTYLRQNALIALLAQAGSFVPAESARIGRVTQLFSRVGAADDLARGRSTFMVEMVETAAILNQADSGALVILDEIGRGTSTYDGLAIAWATLEHLHEINCCRALFATHYHELTGLKDRLPRIANATVAVKEWKGEVVFLHEVVDGAADRSYGVQVAKLAGMPPSVLGRANEILNLLEKGKKGQKSETELLLDDLPLFAAAAKYRAPLPRASPVEDILEKINPDELTPLSALELVYKLKRTGKEET
ncbi:MAG: DNA mismatch repair protein MutS [Albidovulum sp.]|nr:DNA mismatch repair protein MutS [Albidovulum sp.]MDE0532040.1 DNA mismatch repair protein MutS [Albidovulum sp.]